MRTIYLDCAAATPLDEKVLMAMQPYFSEQFYNPSATYGPAEQVHKAVNEARDLVAHHLGAKSNEIIFTSGGTESNNLAIKGVMENHPNSTVLISAVEHDSVFFPASKYKKKTVDVDNKGLIDLEDLQNKIDDSVVLISVMQANNEIGTVQPLRKISSILKDIKKDRTKRKIDTPIYLHTDACQAAGYLDVHVHSLGVDLMTINGGKLHGPKQTGALFVAVGVELNPQILGGGQQRGLRSGTENVAGAIGLATALDIAQSARHEEVTRLETLQKDFVSRLNEALPETIINGPMKHRLVNNVSATFPGQEAERLLILLEEHGILAAAGSACKASSKEPSRILTAIGLDTALARSTIRFSMGRQTTAKDVEKTVFVLKSLLA